MKREFLESLRVEEQPLPGEVIDSILQMHTQALETAEQTHQQELAQLRLQGALESAVIKAGGRSVKAIAALLDMDSIGASDDVPKALDTALQALKKESGYLFEMSAPPPYARFTGTGEGTETRPATLAGALRERMERK